MSMLTQEQEERLAMWRNLALQRMPYFAPILFGMQPNHSTRLTTMAVDKAWRLYINFDAPQYRNNVDAAEDLLHECGHLWARHGERAEALGIQMGERDFNIAGDAEWNDDLVEAGCSTIEATGVLPKHLHEANYESAEFYYKSIKKSQKGKPKPKTGPGTPTDQQGAGAPGEGDPSDNEPYEGCGAGSGGEPGPFGSGIDQNSPSAQPGVDTDTRDNLLQTAATLVQEAVSKGIGHIPGGIIAQAAIILTPPKVNWRRVLAATVRYAAQVRPSGEDWTYQRPSKRRANVMLGPGKRVIFPSTVHRIPRIVVVRDTSGSMSDKDLQAVTAEVVGIAKSMGIRGDDYLVIDVDATAYKAREYTGVQTLATVEGRGGTDMRVGIDAALLHKPDAVIVLTDGETPWPDEPPHTRSRLVACIIASSEAYGQKLAEHVPDFIKTVVVDLSDEAA